MPGYAGADIRRKWYAMLRHHALEPWLFCLLATILASLAVFVLPGRLRRERRRVAWDALRWRDTQERWKDIRGIGPHDLPGATGDGHIVLREAPNYELRGLYAMCAAVLIAPWFLFVSPALAVIVGSVMLFTPLLIPARTICIMADGFMLRTWHKSAWYGWPDVASVEPIRKWPKDDSRPAMPGVLIGIRAANRFSRDETLFLPDHFPIGRDDLAGIIAGLSRSYVVPAPANTAAPDVPPTITVRPRLTWTFAAVMAGTLLAMWLYGWVLVHVSLAHAIATRGPRVAVAMVVVAAPAFWPFIVLAGFVACHAMSLLPHCSRVSVDAGGLTIRRLWHDQLIAWRDVTEIAPIYARAGSPARAVGMGVVLRSRFETIKVVGAYSADWKDIVTVAEQCRQRVGAVAEE